MIRPSITLVAYEDQDPSFVFVKVPDDRGRYVRTDRSVVEVACTHCKAVRGEPCRVKQGYWAGTHANRRRDWQIEKRRRRRAEDPAEPVDEPTVEATL